METAVVVGASARVARLEDVGSVKWHCSGMHAFLENGVCLGFLIWGSFGWFSFGFVGLGVHIYICFFWGAVNI